MIRRSYHFNTTNAARRDGIYLNDPCDIHFRQNADYPGAPYGIDSDGYNVLGIGDRVGYKPNSASLPVQIIGGLHYHHLNVSANTLIGNDDIIINVDTTGGNVTLTLPLLSAATTIDDKVISISKLVRANNLIITPSGADTVEGLTGTQYVMKNPDYTIGLIGDKTTGKWKRFETTPLPYLLVQEIPISAGTITINSGSWQLVRSFANFAFCQRDFFVHLAGSGYCDGTSINRFEFGLFINGVYQSSICLWNNQQSSYHIPFAGSLVYSTTTNGVFSVEIWARRIDGGNQFIMNGSDYLSFNITKY